MIKLQDERKARLSAWQGLAQESLSRSKITKER